ncbi:MAG: acetyltransferase [Candidatus Ozemobacter sibiricus]|uniref:Acetyltransferase n=1 Tax=Candidatus Ozemobacter sibiricus TaxID=2268124 RepID=A0A367ZTG4_9BACT|nr:MAG: acetyltransferase [Candidatus Ozemobacter sibiricus]
MAEEPSGRSSSLPPRAPRRRPPDVVCRGDPGPAGLALARFVRPGCPDRLFEYHSDIPEPADNCLCFFEYGTAAGIVYASLRYALLSAAFAQPFSTPKHLALRLFGASIHPTAYLSPDVVIDPLFPSLLTVEAGALLGFGVRIALHEHGGARFRAGRVIIRRGATIGAEARIGCGVEIGEFAQVAVGAVVLRDVPARSIAVGNPARVVGHVA